MRSEARSEKSELGQARRKVVLRVFFMLRMAEAAPPAAAGQGCAPPGISRARPPPGRNLRASPLPLLGRQPQVPSFFFFFPLE